MSIDEDAGVVAFKCVVDDLFADCVEDIFLMCIWGEDAIEGKGVFVEFDFVACVDSGFIFATGFDSDENLYGIFVGGLLSFHLTVNLIYI